MTTCAASRAVLRWSNASPDTMFSTAEAYARLRERNAGGNRLPVDGEVPLQQAGEAEYKAADTEYPGAEIELGQPVQRGARS